MTDAREYREEVIAPLSTEAITAVLTRRGDRFVVDGEGSVAARWGNTVIYFDRAGRSGELLHVRAIADRRFAGERVTELYEFCNGWNHDRLLPKAYVHDLGDGQLLVAGEVTIDLERGVSTGQLAVLMQTAISASAALADALEWLS